MRKPVAITLASLTCVFVLVFTVAISLSKQKGRMKELAVTLRSCKELSECFDQIEQSQLPFEREDKSSGEVVVRVGNVNSLNLFFEQEVLVLVFNEDGSKQVAYIDTFRLFEDVSSRNLDSASNCKLIVAPNISC